MPRKIEHLCPRCAAIQAKDSVRRNKLKRYKKLHRICQYGGCKDEALKGTKGKYTFCQKHIDYFKAYGKRQRDPLGLSNPRINAPKKDS